MTADEAVAQAEAEGLTLARSDRQSGFRNVTARPECKARPYEANVWRESMGPYLERALADIAWTLPSGQSV